MAQRLSDSPSDLVRFVKREYRQYEDADKPGRLDRRGRMWWACDPYPTWFYWEEDLFGKEHLIKREDNKNVFSFWPGLDGWADEPVKIKPPPCKSGYACRLYSWSGECHCSSWGNYNTRGIWDGPDYDLHVQLAYQELLRKERLK